MAVVCLWLVPTRPRHRPAPWCSSSTSSSFPVALGSTGLRGKL